MKYTQKEERRVMDRKFIRIVFFILCTAVLSSPLFSLEVAEDEIKKAELGSVEFINYRGPYSVVLTLEEIFGIGEELGRQEGDVKRYKTEYTVIHAVDPETEEGLDADIFIIEEAGFIDHIRNVRRILSGYLETTYDYNREDAMLLATFITYYNAVYRQDLEYVSGRYKSVVIDNLDPQKIGIARSYDQWPGKTMLLIPLTERAGEGTLGSLDSDELSDEKVIEDLQEEEDKGLEDRKDLVELKDREIEEEEKAIEEEERKIEEEEERIARREEEEEGEDGEAAEGEEDREAEAAEDEEEPSEEEQELEERREEVEERREELEERRERLEEEREEIAEDQQEVIEREEDEEDEEETAAQQRARGVSAPFLVTREVSGTVYGSISLVDFETGTLLVQSEIDTIRGRRYFETADGYLAVAGNENSRDTAALVLLDKESLETAARSDTIVYDDTDILLHNGSIYAVVLQNGDWRVGKFSREFELESSSEEEVNEFTVFVVYGEYIYAQDRSGTIQPFDPESLSGRGAGE
jgi:hypothetical protein